MHRLAAEDLLSVHDVQFSVFNTVRIEFGLGEVCKVLTLHTDAYWQKISNTLNLDTVGPHELCKIYCVFRSPPCTAFQH